DLVVVDDNRHILVPIGVAVMDEDHDNVIIRSLNRSNVKFYPPYKNEPVTREYEQSLRDSHRYTMLNNDITSKTAPSSDNESGRSDNFRDEGFSYLKNKNNEGEKTGNSSQQSEDFHNEHMEPDQKEYSQAELEVLKKERDIARAERDILKVQLEQNKKGAKDDFYDHEDFDENRFYENRRRKRE
ncbi:MAG: hypothetical protein M3512_11530, partial [Bacteroidota bacterium]|nr:hypothetical protein [Bacteroidota bacterium]